MQNADAVLAVLRERGERGLPLERVYRLLFNRELYLRAYGKIARNAGALTPGATPETAGGMSLAKIDAVIEAVRFERYRWTPVRRVWWFCATPALQRKIAALVDRERQDDCVEVGVLPAGVVAHGWG